MAKKSATTRWRCELICPTPLRDKVLEVEAETAGEAKQKFLDHNGISASSHEFKVEPVEESNKKAPAKRSRKKKPAKAEAEPAVVEESSHGDSAADAEDGEESSGGEAVGSAGEAETDVLT